MDSKHYHLMYGYFFKARAGEGSRGGKVIGHTATGKPIYDSDDKRGDRRPMPGEALSQHELKGPKKEPEGPNQVQRRKTYMPPEGTMPHYADTPKLRAYKNLMRMCKQQGIDFQGHISYDPKADSVMSISDEGSKIVKQIVASRTGNKPSPAAT